jgi:hypothetical protein
MEDHMNENTTEPGNPALRIEALTAALTNAYRLLGEQERIIRALTSENMALQNTLTFTRKRVPRTPSVNVDCAAVAHGEA